MIILELKKLNENDKKKKKIYIYIGNKMMMRSITLFPYLMLCR